MPCYPGLCRAAASAAALLPQRRWPPPEPQSGSCHRRLAPLRTHVVRPPGFASASVGRRLAGRPAGLCWPQPPHPAVGPFPSTWASGQWRHRRPHPPPRSGLFPVFSVGQAGDAPRLCLVCPAPRVVGQFRPTSRSTLYKPFSFSFN